VTRLRTLSVVLFLALPTLACGSSDAASGATEGDREGVEASAGEVVRPPFSVRGNAENLLLVWYDEEGPHTAMGRSEVPTERRAEVRVQSLSVDDADAIDGDSVYVADLRSSGEDGNYTVRRVPRADFDAHIDAYVAGARGEGSATASTGDVIVYGASWCGACRQTEAFLRERGVAFVERDVEEDPTAASDMRRAAAAQGLHPTGIPVIDFRGTIILGFNPAALEEAIRETAPAASGVTI
jgi:glutaredoxin